MDGVTISIAPLALRAAKQAISRAADLPLESGRVVALHSFPYSRTIGLDFERASYEVLLGTKDRIEALEAFKEKRAPVFKGE